MNEKRFINAGLSGKEAGLERSTLKTLHSAADHFGLRGEY
jgi:hypothetical protein